MSSKSLDEIFFFKSFVNDSFDVFNSIMNSFITNTLSVKKYKQEKSEIMTQNFHQVVHE